MEFGCKSEVGLIKLLLLKHPKEAFISQRNVQSQWEELGYNGCPEYHRALEEYDDFVSILRRYVSEIYFLPEDNHTGLDSIYVHDPVIMTGRGAVICNMGKEKRMGELDAVEEFLEESGIYCLGKIIGEGRLEGGDVVIFDEHTLAVGQGYRTNIEGIHQLKEITEEFIDEFVVVPLPHWKGPDDVLHLMSFISPVARDLAVVYSRIMPVPFREWLIQRDIKLIEVPDSEYDTMGCNVLAVAPRKCIMIEGNKQTKHLLENEGVEVLEYKGEEISRKGAGGPTCLTRPLLRKE